MSTNNVFLYWVGKDYKLIKILRELINLHSKNGKGYTVHLINHNNIKQYVDFIPNGFNKLKPAHQADYVRVCAVCKYGGIWLDSDTIVMDKLDSLFEHINNKNGFFVAEPISNKILINGIFGSKPNTQLMIMWRDEIISILKKKGDLRWTEMGTIIMEKIRRKHPEYYKDYTIIKGVDNIYPISWNMCVTEFLNKPFDNYQNIVKPYQPLICLTSSVYRHYEKLKPNIANGKIPINYFINKSRMNFDNADETKTKMNLNNTEEIKLI